MMPRPLGDAVVRACLTPSRKLYFCPTLCMRHLYHGGGMASANFDFLVEHDERLVTLGAFAERYFRDDPSTAIVKLRQFAELMAKLIAARHAAWRDERERFEERPRRRA